MSNTISVHGHFYQPPRTNPFTDEIPTDLFVLENWKGKYKNWNEVIHAECYEPNALVGNFEYISFNMYRSLAEWLEKFQPITYRNIVNSAQKAYQTNGLGSALCGSWNHSILPLLKQDDIEIEVYWGKHDFIRRYGMEPIGFWLPETAVSNSVLNILAKNGFKLVILAPWQAHSPVDTGKLYYVSLPEMRRISVAFYDKQFSDGLSFDSGAMIDADGFASKYLSNRYNSFILGATDGERYGHHFKEGEKFLNHFLTQSITKMGNMSQVLLAAYAQSQPKDEIFIQDNTSWSCLCGDLKRWKQDCECSVDYDRNNARVNGDWKRLLFDAISHLSQNLVAITDSLLVKYVTNPQSVKKEYIHLYLQSMTESEFISKHQRKSLDSTEIEIVMKVLTMQRYRLTSFTSCGWFFADIDRPEPRIVISNAKKALSILGDIGQSEYMLHLEGIFTEELQKIKSNYSTKTGKDLYLEYPPLLAK